MEEKNNKGKLSLSGIIGKKSTKRKKNTTNNSASLDENIMGLQVNDIQSYLDERLDDFKKGFMSDICSVIDHKLKEFEKKIDSKLDKLEKSCKTMIVTTTENSKQNMMEELRKDLENQLGAVGGAVSNPLDNPDVCIIASHVPEKLNQSPMEAAEQVIAALGQNGAGQDFSSCVTVVRAIRLNNRNPRNPALLKFAVQNLEQKKDILRSKGNLKQSPLRKVFLRSSKSHVERLHEINTKTLLNQFEWGQNFRITNNGRLVQRFENVNDRAFDGYGTNRDMGVSECGAGFDRYGPGNDFPPPAQLYACCLHHPTLKECPRTIPTNCTDALFPKHEPIQQHS